MELTIIVLVSLVLLVLAILILSAVFSLRPSATNALKSQNGATNGSLASPTFVGTPQEVFDGFFTGPGGTVSLYLYVGGRQTSPGATLVKIGDALEFGMLPAGPGSNPETILSVRQNTVETTDPIYKIKCADFPIQKWVHVTIVREGRRFTVFYNGSVAADERVSRNIVPVLNPLTVGSDGTPGEWAYVNLTPYAYRLENIESEMAKTSDTRHVPYISPTMSFNLFSCPNGFFCFNANTSQESTLSPLRRWQTPYA
jgi:hypothetical protein